MSRGCLTEGPFSSSPSRRTLPSAWISAQTGYESGSPPGAASRGLVAALQAPSSRPGVSYAPVLRWPRLSISQRFHPEEPVSLSKFTPLLLKERTEGGGGSTRTENGRNEQEAEAWIGFIRASTRSCPRTPGPELRGRAKRRKLKSQHLYQNHDKNSLVITYKYDKTRCWTAEIEDERSDARGANLRLPPSGGQRYNRS